MTIKLNTHPLIQHKLTQIRKKETNMVDFRSYVKEISKLMAYEVLKNLSLQTVNITTPIAKTKAKEIKEKINLFPVLRAGLGMVEGFSELVPNSRIGHIGLYRDHKTLKPVKYLFKAPKGETKNTFNIILDPMLATGGSAIEAINTLKKAGYKNIKLVSIVSSKFGVEQVQKAHKDVEIYVATIDPILTKDSYISPGLGDAGDRLFGTK